MKDSRNWPKIYFMLVLVLIFGGLFVLGINNSYNITQSVKLQKMQKCNSVGAEYYSGENADCIDSMGRLYKVEVKDYPWYAYLFTAFMVAAMFPAICFIIIIIGEYNKW